ncbi:hypothetical protein ACFLYT_00140 [Nanoarchaeota archaeon]
MLKNKIILILVILSLVSPVYASDFEIDEDTYIPTVQSDLYSLEEGETGTFSVAGKQLQIMNVIVTDSSTIYTQFLIDGKTTPKLGAGETYDLPDHLQLKISGILQINAGDVSQDRVEFYINVLPYCGDNLCTGGETCDVDNCCNGDQVNFNTDPGYCGDCNTKCDNTRRCKNAICESCGDNVCQEDEDCASCSNDCGECVADTGEVVIVDLCGDGTCQLDESCMTCAKDCGCEGTEKCALGECVTYCGNGVCEADEYCSTCVKDCGCEDNQECYGNECITHECNADTECDDDNFCTLDTCSGMPRKCSNERQSPGCSYDNNCVSVGTKTETMYCGSDNSMHDFKSEYLACQEDYECSTNLCNDGECKVKGVVKKIFLWFGRLFG